MELGRCPICHHRISLEAIAKDQAGRELAALVAKTDNATGQALLSYLGLFRSPTRDLANDRALVLAREVLALESPQWLAPALIETVEAIHNKRAQGGLPKPLKNHNYLRQVLESVIAQGVTSAPINSLRATLGRDNGREPAYNSAAASRQRLTDTSWAD